MATCLSANGLSVGYHGKPILEGLDLTIRSGELLVLVGSNGAGKTTVLKALAGIARPLAGEVSLDGRNISELSALERARRVAYLTQTIHASWPFTVREFVAQGRFPHRGWFGGERPSDREALTEALERAQLLGFEDRAVTELSGGELQRVLIARAIAQEPEVLLLDEPVSQLDAKYQAAAMGLIRELVDSGLAAAASLHDLNLAGMYADRIALLSEGTLLAVGAPKEVLREDLLRKAFGASMVVGRHPQEAETPAVYHAHPSSQDKK